LCIPESESSSTPALRISESQVRRLEGWIDEDTAQLQPLQSFVLPGGSPGAALLHQARTICRRCEIHVLMLAQQEKVNPQAMIYLNRLSDLLFVMARMANKGGKGDVLWKPGAGT
jgi:cob(I)alamin adenosyltransferase